jgi:hypothetical protein
MFRIRDHIMSQKKDQPIVPEKSRLRVVHNVATGPQVDIYIDDFNTLRGVSYKDITYYIEITSGDHILSVMVGDDKVINGKVKLRSGVSYTLIIHGEIEIEPLLVDDTLECPELGRCHVRFINAAGTFGPIDGYINDIKVFNNIRYGLLENPEYISIGANNIDFLITQKNNQNPILGPISLKLKNGGIYTIITSGIVESREFPPAILIAEDTGGACVIIGI